jgi:2-haloacid dehalogenase
VESGIRALVFDVFGTVVDWPAFADAWRARYAPSMDRVRSGELPWTVLDDLHRASLKGLLVGFGIEGLSEEETEHLNRAWHRLDPWPDAVEGLTRLKRRHAIAPLSNGNVSLLVNMAKRAGLPWDLILSAELARRYKPDGEVYLLAPRLLGLRPEEVMMVAAHPDDLRAASRAELKTAYVPRPDEWGPEGQAEPPDPAFDLVAGDFVELARLLGA